MTHFREEYLKILSNFIKNFIILFTQMQKTFKNFIPAEMYLQLSNGL